MKENNYASYAPTVLRLGLAVLFLTMGIFKLMAPAGIIGLVGNIGLPLAAFFGWLVIIFEILGGLSMLTGLWTEYFTIPLAIIILVAIFGVQIANGLGAFAGDFIVLTGIVSVYFSGPGKWALKL